jgi:hypothetical protein
MRTSSQTRTPRFFKELIASACFRYISYDITSIECTSEALETKEATCSKSPPLLPGASLNSQVGFVRYRTYCFEQL